MAANTSVVFELKPSTDTPQTFVAADTTTKKTIVAGAADSTRVDEISVTTDDTASNYVNFYLNNGSTDFFIGSVALAAGSGFTTVSKVNAIPTLSPVNGYLWIPTGWSLKAAMNATVTSTKTTTVVAHGGVYS